MTNEYIVINGVRYAAIYPVSRDANGEIVTGLDGDYAVKTVVSNNVNVTGNFPSSAIAEFTGSNTNNSDNDILYESDDVSMYNTHVIENTSSTDPIDVYISVNGTNFLTTPSAVRIHDATTSGTHALEILAGDAGILESKFAKKIRVLKKGETSETGSCRGFHGNS